MDPIYTEIEFERFESVPGPFYQDLKSVPTTIIYREYFDGLERLAVILLNDRNRRDVRKIATAHKVKIVLMHDVTQGRLSEIEKGLFPCIDGYDTREGKYWTGEFLHRDRLAS